MKGVSMGSVTSRNITLTLREWALENWVEFWRVGSSRWFEQEMARRLHSDIWSVTDIRSSYVKILCQEMDSENIAKA
jgi:hypothetical protein